jgi:hypothetical protein
MTLKIFKTSPGFNCYLTLKSSRHEKADEVTGRIFQLGTGDEGFHKTAQLPSCYQLRPTSTTKAQALKGSEAQHDNRC